MIDANYVALDVVTYGPNSSIEFVNRGNVTSNEESLDAETSGDNSSIKITNFATVNSGIDGISAGTSAYAPGDNSSITIVNSGSINAGQVGIYASTGQNFVGNNGAISITNSGAIIAGTLATGLEANGHGIYAHTEGTGSTIFINNSAAVTSAGVVGGPEVSGMYALALGDESSIEIVNAAAVLGRESGIKITHAGNITTGTAGITITNTGAITGAAAGASGIDITNEGSIATTATGIKIDSSGGSVAGGLGGSAVKITNAGSIESADAIDVSGAPATVENEGLIAGLLKLTGLGNLFNNQEAGRVETSGTSTFGGATDVFNNAGTVVTALDPEADEDTVFDNLGQFNNSGRVSLVDGADGDTFSLNGKFCGVARQRRGRRYVSLAPTIRRTNSLSLAMLPVRPSWISTIPAPKAVR